MNVHQIAVSGGKQLLPAKVTPVVNAIEQDITNMKKQNKNPDAIGKLQLACDELKEVENLLR